MTVLHNADQEQLQKLLLGQLSTAEVERLATEYADDGRLAELAESLAGKEDALLELLHNHETAVADPEGERLVERLLERLRPALPVKPREDTLAMNHADASTEPSSPDVTGKPQPLPERLEHYRPIKVLGQGGMGTVYLAEDTRLGREVAIKTLRPELAINPQFKQRFLREARTAAKLEHDNIIPIYSVGEAADGTPFLAMPLLKGEPLDALIRRTSGPLPVAMVLRLAREAASGLAAAHARGLIHRDIKPANIWLEAPTGRMKILDFGLAKAADAGSEAESDTHLTASGAIVGTPAYMAPEQASGHTVDGRADLFSLGCVLYELLAGKRAFSGPNTMSILMSLANHTPPAPDKLSPQCPAALSRLVMQLLEKDPANRPASAEAVIQTLNELDFADSRASRVASAPGPSQDVTAVRGLTPSGSPTLVESDLPRPSDSLMTLPATAVLPDRKRAIPKQRVALALGGVLLMLLAAVVYRIQTDQGTLVVTIEKDSAVQAILEQNGLVIHDKNSDRKWYIKAAETILPSGEFQLKASKQLLVTDDSGAVLKTDEFALKRKDEFRVRVALDPAATVAGKEPTTNPDRRAAEWVLSIGGTIRIKENGQERQIGDVGDLPRATFELTFVGLGQNPKVSDVGLAHFNGCQNLMQLDLGGTQVTDAGLAHFKQCKKLTSLGLINVQVSDAGLAHFDGCHDITQLYLGNTKLSDAVLVHFQNCKNLQLLHLGNTNVSDAGLAHFKDCQNLTHLDLRNTKVTDAGLAYFRDCQNLTSLQLYGPLIHDAGLAHFKECKDLTLLDLHFTQVSDAGLAHFAGCPKLASVSVKNTKVTEAGVKKLSAALPGCKIEWDGGVIEPTISPDRRAADYVLSIAGEIKIKQNGQERQPGAIGDLPRGKFELTVVHLQNNQKVSDAGLAHFKDCKNLTHLDLNSTQVSDAGLVHFKDRKNLTWIDLRLTQVSDAGLAHFKDCRNLVLLNLADTQVTDAGLAYFKDCKNLTALYVSGTQVSNAGLAYFQDCMNLTTLQLGETRVSDAGLAHFQDCKNLSGLDLSSTHVSDAGWAHFKDCKNLTYLDLSNTQVTDASLERLAGYPNLSHLQITKTKITEAGVKKFSAALPGCKIEWDGGVIEPTVSPDRRAAEYALSIGGTVKVKGSNDKEVTVSSVTILPLQPFRITGLILQGNRKVTDAGLAVFRGCKDLEALRLDSTSVSDAGLAHFPDCKNLKHLDLSFCAMVTDAGLRRFQDCKKLEVLKLSMTAISDMGLASFQDCQKLIQLQLDSKDITDAGLAHFQTCSNLTVLAVKGGLVTDAGLAHFKDCKKLEMLTLNGTQVSDAGLASFKGCRNLVRLWLTDSKQITDAGVAHFQNCPQLLSLDLSNTATSDAGLAHFAACTKLTQLNLTGTKITNAGLVHFAACTNLKEVTLNDTLFSEAGLEHFQASRNIEAFILGHSSIGDAGLALLQDWKNLKTLNLSLTNVTDAGLHHLKGCKNLTFLSLLKTKTTAAGIDDLSNALPLCRIEWDGGVIEPRSNAQAE